METVTYKNLKFQVWDLGGQTSIRQDVFNLLYITLIKKEIELKITLVLPQAVLAVLLLQHGRGDLRRGQQ